MSWHTHVFSLELRKAFSYRSDFWANFVGVVLTELGVAYFLWRAIFAVRQVDSIGGYTFRGMVLYYLLVPLFTRLMRGNEQGYMSNDIYDGSLSRYLVYPVSFLGSKYLSHLSEAAIALFSS